ncbi:MAG TPA: hypothetical protein VI386_28610, partial [Candidatus Sulfotelmatobacter sp.]
SVFIPAVAVTPTVSGVVGCTIRRAGLLLRTPGGRGRRILCISDASRAAGLPPWVALSLLRQAMRSVLPVSSAAQTPYAAASASGDGEAGAVRQ